MAEFLNKKKLLEWVPKLIETAGKELVIISPYIQISEKIFKLLKESEKRGVEITLIYKEVELSEKERKKFDEIENLNLLYQPNLHSKCIYNEKYLLVTSMNLYEFSQKHNREMGVLFRRTDEDDTGWNDYRNSRDDESIFQDAIEEIKSILTSSEFEKESFETKTIAFEMEIIKTKRDFVDEKCRNLNKFFCRNTCNISNNFWCPLKRFFSDFIHTINTVCNKFFIFPTIFENEVKHTIHKWNVSTWTNLCINICFCSTFCKTWINNDQLRVVSLFGFQEMLETNRVINRWVCSKNDNCFRLLNISKRVCHRSVTPCIRHTGDCGRVSNSRLMICIIGTKECSKLSKVICLLIAHFC